MSDIGIAPIPRKNTKNMGPNIFGCKCSSVISFLRMQRRRIRYFYLCLTVRMVDFEKKIKIFGIYFYYLSSSKISNHSFLNFSRLLGGHNWYSLGFLSSWPASLAAIFLERPSRRGALSIYVCYIVSWNKNIIVTIAVIL